MIMLILRVAIRKNSTCVFANFIIYCCALEVYCVTIWHIQKLYRDEGLLFEAIPYDLVPTIKYTLKMKNGIVQAVKFLSNSRLSEKSARRIADKKKTQTM